MASFRLASTAPTTVYFPPWLAHPQMPLRLLTAGRELMGTPSAATAPRVLPPGRQRQYRFVLSRLADLTMPGDYGVQVSRVLAGGATVVSPPLRIRLQKPYDGLPSHYTDTLPSPVDDGQGEDTP